MADTVLHTGLKTHCPVSMEHAHDPLLWKQRHHLNPKASLGYIKRLSPKLKQNNPSWTPRPTVHRERNQKPKATQYVIPLTGSAQNRQIQRQKLD